jgi:hypothetical protein
MNCCITDAMLTPSLSHRDLKAEAMSASTVNFACVLALVMLHLSILIWLKSTVITKFMRVRTLKKGAICRSGIHSVQAPQQLPQRGFQRLCQPEPGHPDTLPAIRI